jgi:hypothetical protein
VKKILWLLFVGVAFVYGIGAAKLSESSASAFIDELETLSLRGESGPYCARLHEKLTVSINDRTAPDHPRQIKGGKAQFCEYVSEAAKGMSIIRPETRLTREDFTVTRSWLHPWTAHVTYHEIRTTTMTLANITLNTVGDDKWTLVYTLGGLKVLRLESESGLADQPVPPTVRPSTRSVG